MQQEHKEAIGTEIRLREFPAVSTERTELQKIGRRAGQSREKMRAKTQKFWLCTYIFPSSTHPGFFWGFAVEQWWKSLSWKAELRERRTLTNSKRWSCPTSTKFPKKCSEMSKRTAVEVLRACMPDAESISGRRLLFFAFLSICSLLNHLRSYVFPLSCAN